ncbi:hypothetical protein MPSEU_000379800 [Mayamaea pseudoterrestris]|nr:hypothetical protein MPSEU_000379800 [Mayamaea pseudoterrestris]
MGAAAKNATSDRKIAISVYGFPPNVGAVGTAALLDVPRSLEMLLARLHKESYNLGDWAAYPDASGESLVAALAVLCEDRVVVGGADRMPAALENKIERASGGDRTVAESLGRNGGVSAVLAWSRRIYHLMSWRRWWESTCTKRFAVLGMKNNADPASRLMETLLLLVCRLAMYGFLCNRCWVWKGIL